MVRRERGSITVFLTLTGLLLFALLGTLVETARLNVCANHAARTLRTATEALMTEYSRPLFEHYGLLFMEQAGTPYEEVIARYAGDMMEGTQIGKMDFLSGFFQEIQVVEKQCAGDRGANALSREITAYMERKLVKKQLQNFLKKSEGLQKTDEKAVEVEEMAQEQKKLAELDVLLLDLIKLVDGISVTKHGVRCENDFVKSFSCRKKPKGIDFGVTKAAVFKEMKKKLDQSPSDWSKLNRTSFLKKLHRVEKVTKQAVEKGNLLKNKYRMTGAEGKDDSMVARIVKKLPMLQGNLRVIQETQSLLSSEQTEDIQGQLSELWKDYDTKSLSFDYTGVEEKGGGENPLHTLSDAWENGILGLVCKTPSKLSGETVKNPDYYADYYEMTDGNEEDYGKRVLDFTKEEKVELSGVLKESGSKAWDEFCLMNYITDTFGSMLEKKQDWKHTLSYQWEYIIGGKESDRANLTSVLNRILLLRTIANVTAIFQDAAKKSEAYAAAAAVIGFTGMEPLIRFTQTVILIVWSMVEGLVDLAGLLQERDVPLVKTPKQILTTFPELFLINNSSITKRAAKFQKAKQSSFGYGEYIKLFLMTMKGETKRYRIMDLIQWDMQKNGYRGFDLGSSVFSLKVHAEATFPTRLFLAAPVKRMLERSMAQYTRACEIESSYL